MPVDYKLRNLRRLFGESNFLRPIQSTTKGDGVKTARSSSASDSNVANNKMVEFLPGEIAQSGLGRTSKSAGGIQRPFFSEQSPRALKGKAVSGHMFSLHLYEKQKMKVYYGAIRDGQFRHYVLRAKAKRFNTDAELLRLLELRLDTFLYRTGFVKTPMQARQWIYHGQVRVNNQYANIKSFAMTPGDILSIRDGFEEQAFKAQGEAALFRKQCGVGASWILARGESAGMTPWMEIDRVGLSAALVREPNDDELRAMRRAALFPFIRDANMDPHSAMRSYK